jgi:hypothetical protein
MCGRLTVLWRLLETARHPKKWMQWGTETGLGSPRQGH